MNIDDIQGYTHAELTTLFLSESNGQWNIEETKAFRKGLKKYSNDKTVMKAYKELKDFILSHDDVPPVRSYPPHLNIHQIKRDKRFVGSMWGHLKGQKIGILFYVRQNSIAFVFIGTHQQLGWS